MNNHTKGPWSVENVKGVFEVKCNDETIAVVQPISFTKYRRADQGRKLTMLAANQANAALIASAPELLEQLEYLTRVLEVCFEQGDGPETAVGAAKALIAKAKGGDQ